MIDRIISHPQQTISMNSRTVAMGRSGALWQAAGGVIILLTALLFGSVSMAQPLSGVNGPCDNEPGRMGGQQLCAAGLVCQGPFEGIYGRGNCQQGSARNSQAPAAVQVQTVFGVGGPCDTRPGRDSGVRQCSNGLNCIGPYEGIYGQGNCQPDAPVTNTRFEERFKATCPEWMDGCDAGNTCTRCDSSCGEYCQNVGGEGCGPSDCKSCPPGYDLNVIYGDGSGECLPTASAPVDDYKFAFVTLQTYDGNLGGLSGADRICQEAAIASGYDGIYKAWLSDGRSSPSSRFSQHGLQIRASGGYLIAGDWGDLTDGQLLERLNTDEYGNDLERNPGPWTGTNEDGSSSTLHCRGWTSADRGTGDHGCTSTTAGAWTMCGESGCDSERPLYCFEQ